MNKKINNYKEFFFYPKSSDIRYILLYYLILNSNYSLIFSKWLKFKNVCIQSYLVIDDAYQVDSNFKKTYIITSEKIDPYYNKLSYESLISIFFLWNNLGEKLNWCFRCNLIKIRVIYLFVFDDLCFNIHYLFKIFLKDDLNYIINNIIWVHTKKQYRYTFFARIWLYKTYNKFFMTYSPYYILSKYYSGLYIWNHPKFFPRGNQYKLITIYDISMVLQLNFRIRNIFYYYSLFI